MAGKYDEYEKILYGNKSSEKSQLEKNQGTIANYQARLAAGGVNPEEAVDKRNFLEKALNLKQDQNFIFDIFELINRPQQALFGGIESLQQGGDFLEGAGQGITGNKETRFKDILMNTDLFDDEKGKLDLVDVLGFAGDVFLDPMDIPLIPVSAVSKGAKALDTVSDVAKATDTAGDVLKAADTATDIAKATEFISPTQWLGRTAKKGIKGAASVADTGLEKLFNKVDELKGTKYAMPDAEWASELGKMGDGTSLLETYKGLKNNISTMFSTKLSKNARQVEKLNDAKEAMTRMYLEENSKKIVDMLDNTATKLGKTSEEVSKDINKIIDVTSEISLRDVINGAQNGTVKYSDEIVNSLKDLTSDLRKSDANKLLNAIGKTDNGMLKLSEDWADLIDNFDVEKLSNKVARPSLYSEKQLKEFADLTDFYNKNAPEAVQAFKDFYNDGNKAVQEMFSSFEGVADKYDLRNLEGYSKHKMSDDYKENLLKLTDYGVDPAEIQSQLTKGSGMGTGAATLNTRKYQMSAGEANILKKQELTKLPGLSEEGKKFVQDNINLFDDNAMAGINEYINNMPKYAKNTQMVDEIMMKQGFGDVKKMRELRDALRSGLDAEGKAIDRASTIKELNQVLDNSPFRLLQNGKAPAGFKKLDQDTKNYLVRFLQSTGDKTGNKELLNMSQQLKYLDNMAIDPTVLNILKINTDTVRKNEFINMYDKMMNYFKGNKTASLTNQMNNISGNISNMMLSGMSANDLATYMPKAISDLNGYEELLRRGLTDYSQLSKAEQEIFDNLRLFQENVSLLDNASIAKKYDIDGVIKQAQKDGTKLPLDKFRGFMANLNAQEDKAFKYAMFLKSMDDPKFVKNLGIVSEGADKLAKAKAAGQAVNKVLFDPSDLTAFENNVMKKVVPFYTFTKKNLAYQITNMGDNLQNYNKLMKGYKSLTSSYGDDYDNMADYLRDNMYIPIPSIGKDGKYSFVRAQLPFGDLTDIASNPINSLVNRTSPFVKLPYELATNRNTFTGRDIESFPGEQGSIDLLSSIPGLNTAKGEEILSSLTGLDTPIKQLDRLVSGAQSENPLDTITNNLTIGGNVDTDKLNRSYEQIENLQNLMKQYQQKGYTFSTISELKKANKNSTIEGIQAIFNKYGIQ